MRGKRVLASLIFAAASAAVYLIAGRVPDGRWQ